MLTEEVVNAVLEGRIVHASHEKAGTEKGRILTLTPVYNRRNGRMKGIRVRSKRAARGEGATSVVP